MSDPAPIIPLMKGFLRHLIVQGEPDKTYYKVSKDGALILDRDALLSSGKMQRQLDAARELKKQAARASKRSQTAARLAESIPRDK